MIGIAIPLHLRGQSGVHIVPNINHLLKQNVQILICGSEGKHSQKFAEQFEGVHYAEIPQPYVETSSGGSAMLRKKFNDSIAALQDIGTFSWYCLVGANDIVSADFWAWLEEQQYLDAMAGIDFENPVFMIEGRRNVQVKLSYKGWSTRLAPGVNAFTPAYLEKCIWRPYQKPNDEVGAEILARELHTPIIAGPGWMCAVKSRHDLNTFNHIIGRHRVCDIPEPYRTDVFEIVGLK